MMRARMKEGRGAGGRGGGYGCNVDDGASISQPILFLLESSEEELGGKRE